jgi:hypothetical protein
MIVKAFSHKCRVTALSDLSDTANCARIESRGAEFCDEPNGSFLREKCAASINASSIWLRAYSSQRDGGWHMLCPWVTMDAGEAGVVCKIITEALPRHCGGFHW